MPCDTVQTAQLDFGKADKATLDATMLRLGIPKGSYELSADGKLTIFAAWNKPSMTLEQIKQEYSKTIVYSQAKRFGWAVKEQPDGKLQVMKKAF